MTQTTTNNQEQTKNTVTKLPTWYTNHLEKEGYTVDHHDDSNGYWTEIEHRNRIGGAHVQEMEKQGYTLIDVVRHRAGITAMFHRGKE